MAVRSACFVALLVLTVVAPTSAAEETRPPEKPGLVPIGDAYFPVPKGAVPIALSGGDFETGGEWPAGWVRNRCEVVTGDDAPQGRSYCRMPAANRSLFRLPADTKGIPGRPHLLSFWARSPAETWAPTSLTWSSPVMTRTLASTSPRSPMKTWIRKCLWA